MSRRVHSCLAGFCLSVAALLLAGCGEALPPDPRSEAEIAAEAASRLPADPVLAEKYTRSCQTCHADPATSAPLSGDIRAWARRLELRRAEGLLTSTIEGYGAMPPMGLCADCTRGEFEALIAFLADQPEN